MIARNFGIEMELADITQTQALSALRSAGLRAEIEGYNHIARPHWKIVTDSSVRNGFEVVSPILRGEHGLQEAESAATALETAGAKINTTCGLHVHFDAAGLEVNEIRTIATRYAKHEAEIDAFMPRSRRGDANTYCKSTRRIFESAAFQSAETVDELIDAQGSRYFKLNLQSYRRHQTIEFRQHGGTVNAEKIHNWVYFLNGFITESRCRSRGCANLPTLKGAQAKLVSLLADEGRSADFLQETLNLLPHSLRAAISYLRRAGVGIESARRNGQTIYRLAQGAAQVADTLFNGIDDSIRNFYSNRAAALA
ncbi:MAG: amidoligase family protein [Desulfovibrio sp.]|jgi:biotin operon repressor|nr:amidoligase family protein [Desulfovibrio sp.]